MLAVDADRAVAAALLAAADAGLSANEAAVLNDSNRLVVRVMPCDVVARVAPLAWQPNAAAEVDIVQRLTALGGPVAGLDPQVGARDFIRDGFAITLWATIEHEQTRTPPPAAYADALGRLHACLRHVAAAAPHVTDRVTATGQWAADRDATPDLVGADRALLADTLRDLSRHVVDRSPAEQLLHGEPHPWNVLSTTDGPMFIDFENAARGPVEFDLAWTPRDVSDHYPDADQQLVGDCRGLVLAIIATHRWRHDDQHPSGRQSGEAFLDAIRRGPPWPALDTM